jgi:hypothetical protein
MTRGVGNREPVTLHRVMKTHVHVRMPSRPVRREIPDGMEFDFDSLGLIDDCFRCPPINMEAKSQD